MLSQQVMSYADVKREYLTPFRNVEWFYSANDGFIVWRMGTGNNVELLHIKAWEQRKGIGRRLFYHMLDSLEKSVESYPYHSVYGFTRVSNERAIGFYNAMGFDTIYVPGIYQDGACQLFHRKFTTLLGYRDSWRFTRR